MKISIPQAAPHVRNPGRVPSLMTTVLIALSPITLFAVYQFGWPALNLIGLCLLSALLFEILCLYSTGKPLDTYILDGSGMLTALLLALSLPPHAPWWIAICGSGFAIIVGKHVYGGIGQNPFNPAMLARVALLLSFPVEMTHWTQAAPLLSTAAPSFIEGLQITFQSSTAFDGLTAATTLGQLKTDLSQGLPLQQLTEQYFQPLDSSLGLTAGSLGETSSLLIAIGGLYLLRQRIFSWRLPTSFLGSLLLLSTTAWILAPEIYASPLFHLTSGGVMLAAFFIVTDPVTSPCTRRGQLLFGTGCGALTFVIRTWGGYPEGVAFAVLLMNAMTPLIDHYVRPRRYGRSRTGTPIKRPLWRRIREFFYTQPKSPSSGSDK
ncbi:RnfABCDGE type electron transport complex subunit D [Motiliproteus sp. MSK22-1]|uniref:RnfABCDGE type electron transport complex subunit D n=1 Tax=Motiliproteus sp. MSK22-1 TaxID=1897630 RepID=UPI0009773F1B|nr:RnfABCDGE type electron transport complex subunit D [Motiliproteus sp. MSK22-1]OMH33847.1 electron transporter RnfD [Motiliproteus sp. MSK22-1]